MRKSLLNYMPYVFSCRTCLVPYMLSYPTCLVSYVLSCLMCSLVSRVLCPTRSRALRASCPKCFVPQVLSCPTCLVPQIFLCLTCPCPTCFHPLRASCPTCSRTSRAQYLSRSRALYLTCLTCVASYMPRAKRYLMLHVPYMFQCHTCLVPCVFLGCSCLKFFCSLSLTSFRYFKLNMLLYISFLVAFMPSVSYGFVGLAI